MDLADLPTPCLIVDRDILERNCQAMKARAEAQGVGLRPHMKTSKSIDVANRAAFADSMAITVSTLAEARYFAEQGVRDIAYAVGMVPSKVPEAVALINRGVALWMVIDSIEAAEALQRQAEMAGAKLSLLIEIDTGGERAGLDPAEEDLLRIGRFVDAAGHLELVGVLTHAGHSYHCHSINEIKVVAEAERAGAVQAAERLRAAGLPCPVVSTGSTPTAVHGDSFAGLTEIRPGVFVFFDLSQVGIGSCQMGDIALSVLATVTGHNRRSGHILVDAGGLALSKDVGASEHLDNVGYGLVCLPEHSEPFGGLYIADVHQEHGLIAAQFGELPYDALPLGSRVRILPNHACMTAAAYDRYHVVAGGTEVLDTWPRINGW